MGSFYMEATQINYRRDETLKTVDQKLQELSETSAIDTDIAPVFSKTATYNPGDMVYYKNKLYVFNVEHTGAWAAGDVTATDVTTEISSLKSGLTNVQSDVKLNTNDLTTPSRTKNILPITLASIKALNTDGTWSGSSYTVNGVTFAVSTDSNGNISKINATGTASGVTYLILVTPFDTVSFAGCLINGLPSEGSSNSFNYRIASSASWSALQDINSNNTAITNNGATCRIAIRIQDTYEIATGGIDFYPMVRLSTITDATFEPYIPSVESRIEAVESGLTSYNKLFETSNSGTYRDKFNSMHATINALSYHDKVASFIDFNGTICRFTDISGTIYTYVGTYWSSGVLKSRVVSVDSQYSAVKIVSIDTTGTTVTDENSVEDTKKFALYL